MMQKINCSLNYSRIGASRTNTMLEIKIKKLIDIRYYGDRYITVGGLRQCGINHKKLRRHIFMCNKTIKRGDIYSCDLSPVVGSEQGGIRPVLIIQLCDN